MTDIFLRLPEVIRRTGKKKSSIYDDPDFPKSFPIGPRAVAWSAAEIAEWQRERIALRDGSTELDDVIPF